MRILILDLDQMLGHVLKLFFEDHGHEVVVSSSDPSNDDYHHIEETIAKIQPDAVINCIASLIQDSEINHARAVLLNSFLPHYLDSLSQKYSFKLVHRSTDCIFEGTTGNYTEASVPDATSFYGKTKALGEVNNDRTLTLRVSIIGPDQNPNGESLFPWFLRQTDIISGYSQVFWTGITTIEFARIIELGLKNNLSGIYNVSNGSKIAKSDLLRLFAKYYPTDVNIIDNPNKQCDKSLVASTKFNFEIPSYDEMIKNMREWTDAHTELYPLLRERINK